MNDNMSEFRKNLGMEEVPDENIRTASRVALDNCKEEKFVFKFECPVCSKEIEDWMRTVLWAKATTHIQSHLLKKHKRRKENENR